VRFASLVADGHSTGRAGLGAVLGWKNLKAVTVSGQQELPVFNPEGVLEINRQWHTKMREIVRKPDGNGVCRSCPLHCPRHRQQEEALLNELGLDAFGAEAARKWAEEQGLTTETIYEDIAFRRGIGESLAEGIQESKNKGGKRRGGSYGSIAQAFGLTPEEDATEEFCRNFSEAVSACGQCIFTANAFPEACYPLKLLEQITGEAWNLSRFLALGEQSRNLERQLKDRYRE
jgi:aldehyde:ferredoxin oxidoreductase